MNRTEKKIALNKQINEFADDLKSKAGDYKHLAKDALIVGGIVLAGYAISRLFTDEDEEESEEKQAVNVSTEPSIFSSALKGVATSVLLAVAKSKLTDILENYMEREDE
ncbi:MAG: hypothetical protein NXI00_18010 [Cytophagales bacterium]|nr:hypothetical protein [Cytophagales bacterium]